MQNLQKALIEILKNESTYFSEDSGKIGDVHWIIVGK